MLHQYACVAFAGLAVVLIATAPAPLERVAAAVFGGCLVLSFGVSALYHRITWEPAARRLMRRLDHAALYLVIAGTYTPFGVLVFTGALRYSVLGVVWIGAAVAIALKLIWVDAPKWLSAAIAVGLGWTGVVALPEIFDAIGWGGVSLVAAGGLLYTAGAIVYARGKPDPFPAVFGYHELFHVFTILAAGCNYAAIAFFVLHMG